MTLASYRNGVFYSIRLKFRIDVVEHLLITQVYFWNDNKMLKVKNSTSKKKYENLCLRVYYDRLLPSHGRRTAVAGPGQSRVTTGTDRTTTVSQPSHSRTTTGSNASRGTTLQV